MCATLFSTGAAGEPLVLVPGLAMSGRYFERVAALLARTRPVYVVELPGFGRSAGPPRALDVAGHADALASWLDAYSLPRSVFYGGSFGCQVVVDLAVRYPERVSRLVLSAPSVDAEARTVAVQLTRLLRAVGRAPLRFVPMALADVLRAGPRRFYESARHALTYPLERMLPQVRAPALVLCGGRDPLVPARWADAVADLVQHGSLVRLPSCGHMLAMSAPHDVAAAVVRFLAAGAPPPGEREDGGALV